jgi:hypothetical protein
MGVILASLKLFGSVADVVLAVVGAGALGAFVSVASRLTRGAPFVAYKQGPLRLAAFGALRPIVGSVLGAAACAFVAAGLASAIKVSPSNGKQALAYSVIAFLAGFSERFAQDVLLKTPLGPSPSDLSAEPE